MRSIDIVTAVIGTALIGSGLYGVFFPANMARVFGVIDVTRDMTVFYPGIGVRNFSAGLAVWAYKYTGQQKALGIFLLCWMWVGVVDTSLLLTHYADVDTVWVHVFNTCLLIVTSLRLIMGN